MSRPALLFLDEPTVGIDPQSRNHIFETILGLRAEGQTILYTTHYMEEADRLCDRLGIIDNGRVIAEGSPTELKSPDRLAGRGDAGGSLPQLDPAAACGTEICSVPWHIAVLEVKRFAVDPGRLAFSLALPVVLFALMYGAFSESGQFNGTAHLVDLG